MDKIGDIVGKRLNQYKLGESARAAQIVMRANELFQGQLGCSEEEVRAFRLKDGVLYVGTVGSVWSQEVFQRQTGVMDEIRREHGSKSVLRIVIKSLTSN